MPYRRWFAALATAGLLLLLAACNTTSNDTRSATAGMPNLAQTLAANEWLLDRSDSSVGKGAEPVTLVFGDRTVSGVAPCNTYRGTVSIDEGDETLEITGVATTLKACEPSVMRAEQDYFTALGKVRDVDVSDHYDRLVLTGGGARLAFDAYNPYETLVGEWHVVNVNTGTSLTGPVAGTDPVVFFSDNGDVTLLSGCNTAGSTFRLDGTKLSVDAMRQTHKHCEEPAGVMAQEAALIKALEGSSRVQISPDQLAILDAHGHIAIVAVPPAAKGK